MKYFLTGVLLLFAANSVGVSRVGGGKIDSQNSLCELSVPQSFGDLEQAGPVVIANGPVSFRSGGMMLQTLQIREFSDYYSKLSAASRQDLENYFTSTGWSQLPFPNDPCIDLYEFSNDSSRGFAATWGGGRGVTVTGPNTGLVQITLEQVMQSLKLQAGACSWK